MKKLIFTSLAALMGFWSVKAQDIPLSDAKRILVKDVPEFKIDGVSEEPIINGGYNDASTGIQHYSVQQQYKGIKVYNSIQVLAYKDAALQSKTGSFIPNIANKVTSATVGLTAMEAVSKAASHLNLPTPQLAVVNSNSTAERSTTFNDGGIATEAIKAQLLWVPNNKGGVELAWNVNVSPKNTSDIWDVKVNAQTGAIISKNNYTVYETFSPKKLSTKKNVKRESPYLQRATQNSKLSAPPTPGLTANYLIIPYPYENLQYSNGPQIESNPWTKAGTGNKATTNGWHSDGTNNYTITRGNNVYAYDDSLNKNGAPAGRSSTSTTPSPSLTFVFQPNFSVQPYATSNRQMATTNLFYWNNTMHDVMYQYGFDEPSGNFQQNNLGRGGSGGDFVRAEAQDGSGTNNANFSTQPDGGTARMQMYIWDGTTKLNINSPSAIAGDYTCVESGFSTANSLSKVGPVTAELAVYDDVIGDTAHKACNGIAVSPLFGKIAVINRGGCNFTVKVKNAQSSGAFGVIMANNIPGAPPFTMGGTDNTITIPAVMVSYEDGLKLDSTLNSGTSVTATLSSTPKIDGSLDDGVMCHEYTHGISNRLTGGPKTPATCLQNAEQGGEGWSDYNGLMMTTNWATATINDGTKLRPIGNYAFGEDTTGSGLRTYPYTTDMSVNKNTYSDVGDPANQGEVHRIGEVWCSVLWDMTWAIIQQVGYINPDFYNNDKKGGNSIAQQLVIEGMKLQPCSPGYIDGRNAIMKADSILFHGRHLCSIWNAFARRGMGFSANQGSSNAVGDETVAYDLPTAGIAYPLTLCARDSATVTYKGIYGGTFTSTPGLAIDSVSGTINLANSTPGTYTINYAFQPTCSISTTTTVTIQPLVAPSVVLVATPGSPSVFTANATNAGTSPVYTFIVDTTIVQKGSSNTYVGNLGAADSISVKLTNGDACTTVPTVVSNTISGSTLPLFFSSISGKYSNGLVQLNWQTTGNSKGGYFTIEKKTPNGDFIATGKLSYPTTSSVKPLFNFNDANNLTQDGSAYYRVKWTGTDGSFVYSDVVQVGTFSNLPSIKLYPNPAKSTLRINVSSNVQEYRDVKIMDISGKVVFQQKVLVESGSNLFQLPIATLAKGNYLLNMKGNTTSTLSFIKE